MTDTFAVLRRGHPKLPRGILIPDVMIRAAQLEDITLPVAAAILEGESGGGRNIWGADGGLKVRTNGTYTPRTEVTKATYLAYRTEMRAKRIIRQGAGPCQCTSAQYQDTADALGGTWDVLANCRSGFRGMGALIKKHGVRGGSRRYNGAGDAAEAYAARFVEKHDRWVALGLPNDPHTGSIKEADLDPHQAQQLDYIASTLPDLARRIGRIEAAAGLTVQQLCGEAATIEKPWPGAANGGGWAGADGRRRTPVNFLQDILAAVKPTSLGQPPSQQ